MCLSALPLRAASCNQPALTIAVISDDPQSSQQQSSSDTPSASSKPHSKNSHRVRVEDDPGPSAELTHAEEAIQKHDYTRAEPILQSVVAGDPANYEAWFDLGFVESRLDKLSESIEAYRKSVAAKPDIFESNLNLGVQLAKVNHPDAEVFLRAATQLKPTDHPAEGLARAWLSLGQVLEKSKPEEALAAYQHATTLSPKDAEAHLDAGRLLERQNKFADAEQEYKTVLALNPDKDARADALTGLANIYMTGRRFPEAEEFLKKLVAAQPDDAAAHVQLGRVLAAEEKNDAAIAELEAGAKLAPADPTQQRELADLYLSTGKIAQAEASYRTLLTTHPNDPELHHELGKTLLHEKKFSDAQQEFLIAVKLKPDYGEAYGDLAFAASENKEYMLTIKALDMRAKSLPEVPTTYFLRASAFDHLRDMKQAAANYHLFLNTANGKYPDQEWQAKHRLIAIEPKK
jgi:tetratricopeptide (TPR) repeat protein